MALYDNKYWLLSHIRNSFISTDDTGNCELVMKGEILPRKLVNILDSYTDPDESSEDEEEVEDESYNRRLHDTQFSRLKYDMPSKMEKLAQAKKRAAKIKQVKWEDTTSTLNTADLDNLFSKKTIETRQQVTKSLLSEQLHNLTNIPRNPFMEYAKFDGSAHIGIPIRKFKIFLTMLREEDRSYPISVVCIAAAKIHEFIGLILLKCSTVHGDISLKSVSHYGLYLTEDDGEVDGDFPSLDPREYVAKFAFPYLSLVEQKREDVYFENNEDEDVEMEAQLSNATTVKGLLLQDAKDSNGQALMEEHNSAMEAQVYKSFQVSIISKVKSKIDIHLGVSGEKIEIDPVQHRNSKFPFVRQKAVSHHIDSIGSCDIVEIKGIKAIFRIMYSSAVGTPSTFLDSNVTFKHYDFEADGGIVKEIVQKINQILEIRSSVSRREYREARERKLQKKKSFNLNKQ